jgi:hypothetical protein
MKTSCHSRGRSACAAALLSAFAATAQIIFTPADLPRQFGDNFSAYVSHDVAVSNLIGNPGGLRRWDFSATRAVTEAIHRTDIVATSDGGHAGGFPDATYAEREFGADDGIQAWRYYSIPSGQGRLYHGFHQPADGASSDIVFNAPTTDVPAVVAFGDTWNRAVDWAQLVLGFPMQTHFTASAVVDAYGTLVLPNLGEVPALRVKQLDTYELTLGTTPLGSQFNTNFYWLVKDIGIAAQVIFHVDNLVIQTGEGHTNTVMRVFEARPWRAAELQVWAQTNTVLLSWRAETNHSGYRVESLTDVASTNWQLAGEVATNVFAWPLPALTTQQFFRVSIKP